MLTTPARRYNMTTLDNGLRVASHKLLGLETVSLAVAVDVGSRYESEADAGISHMLEHMAFKGTQRRSARDIAEEFDNIGGHLNAYTSTESTVYYARVLKQNLPQAADILADILQHSTFDETELAREQQVICQEIAMHQDTPDELVFDHFHDVVYPNQSIGHSILGTPQTVGSFTADDMRRYMGQHYHTPNIVVAAAGNVDHDALVALISEKMNAVPTSATPDPTPARYIGGDKRIERDFEQLHVMLGFEGFASSDPDYYAMQLFSLILGGGMSSRLFQEVREKRGLVYTVYSFVTSYRDSGLLGIYAATGEEQAGDLMSVLCDEMNRMANGVTPGELERAKNQHTAHLQMMRESPSSVAEWIARHLHSYGEYRTAKKLSERIQSITSQDMVRVAERVLTQSKPTVTALGPLGQLESYDKTCERFHCSPILGS